MQTPATPFGSHRGGATGSGSARCPGTWSRARSASRWSDTVKTTRCSTSCSPSLARPTHWPRRVHLSCAWSRDGSRPTRCEAWLRPWRVEGKDRTQWLIHSAATPSRRRGGKSRVSALTREVASRTSRARSGPSPSPDSPHHLDGLCSAFGRPRALVPAT